MEDFAFEHVNPDFDPSIMAVRECAYCSARLSEHLAIVPEWRGFDVEGSARFWGCDRCGWWHASAEFGDWRANSSSGDDSTEWSVGGCGALKALDLRDINSPLQEVRDYLAARFEQRNQVHPRLFELTVGSVFRDIGYEARVTAYTADGGIDVVLSAPDGALVGVQVKRTKHRIEAEQIRSFTGALFISGYAHGVFVTTSRFRKGAKDAASLSRLRGIPVELVDASRFLEILCDAQSRIERFGDEWMKARLRSLHVLSEATYPWRSPCPT